MMNSPLYFDPFMSPFFEILKLFITILYVIIIHTPPFYACILNDVLLTCLTARGSGSSDAKGDGLGSLLGFQHVDCL